MLRINFGATTPVLTAFGRITFDLMAVLMCVVRGARKLTGENLKVVVSEFSTLS